jgi:RimJ/RimL family protein N-acetyltransferase
VIYIERQTNAKRINEVINDPNVRPWVADLGVGILDITANVENPRNILLMGEHGGCFFFWLGLGIYEVHTQVLPSAPPHWTRELTSACAHYMFTKTNAWEIMTRVPQGHIAARAAALTQGMKHEFTRPKECYFRGELVDVNIHSFRLPDWVPKAPGMVEIGEAVHKRMHDEAKRLGITTPAHPDDENHNRYVGVTYEMITGGQVDKGVQFYNRWAVVSRHETITLLERNPPTIRMDVGVLRFVDGELEMVRSC